MRSLKFLLLAAVLACGVYAPLSADAIRRVTTDDFNRSDSGSLGANWTDDSGDWQIVSNRASVESGVTFTNIVRYTGTSFADDQYAQLTLAGTATGGARIVGVTVRATDASNLYVFWADLGTDILKLEKYIGGTPTAFWETDACGGTSAGDVIKLSVVGTTLTAYVNSVALTGTCAPVTDSALTSGTAGMFAYDASLGADGIGADDFEADDIGGGSPSFIPAIINNPARGGGKAKVRFR